MRSRIFEFRWKDVSTPYFRLIRNGELFDLPLPINSYLSLEITENAQCAGFEKAGVWFSCSSGARGVRKCEECKKKEGMPIAQYCDGFNTDLFSGAELETLNSEHYVYFALFDRNLIKVGVSSSSRGYLRQIEQGSHFAMVIAEKLWGIPARQIETIIKRNGMADKVQVSQKKDLVFPHITPKEGKEILLELVNKHLPVITATQPHFSQFLKNPPDFLEFESFYHLTDAERVQKPLHDPSLEVGEYLSGKILCVKGSFLVVETDAEKILLDAKRLKGFEVDFSPKPIGLKKEEAFQGALF